MNRTKHPAFLVTLILTVVLLAFANGKACAQPMMVSPATMPGGDPVVADIPLDPYGFTGITVTSHGLYYEEEDFWGPTYSEELWTTTGDISDAWIKRTSSLLSVTIIVITADETAHQLQFGFGGKLIKETTLPTTPTVGGDKPGVIVIGGDDLYLSTTKGMFVTHDNLTWEADSSGLGPLTGDALTLDSTLNVYIGTKTGIFEQAPQESLWHLLPGSPVSVDYLFTTPQDVIYASQNGSQGQYLVMSTDRSTSWHPDSAGMGSAWVRQLSIDPTFTLYAISHSFFDGDHLWTQPLGGIWRSMDSGLPGGLTGDPSSFVLRSIVADSVLHLGTTFGEFDSRDHGATWKPVTRGLPATNVYDFYKFPSGAKVMTTSLGLFTKGSSDTSWTKRFPQNSYLSGIKFFVDNAGRMYAIGASRTVNYNTLPPDIFISTDQGTSWTPDTAGLSNFSNGLEFVDEMGTEYLASSDQAGVHLRAKQSSDIWRGDSTGFSSMPGDGAFAFATDHHGSIYLVITNSQNGNRMLRRSLASRSWSEISTSALGGVPYAMTLTKDGKLIGGNTNTSVGYFDGTSWNVMPNPPGLTNPSGYPESVDSSNRVWVIYGSIDQNYYYTSYGTYWTSDLGQHWTQAADGSLNFSSLVSFGDTTYGLNSGSGLYYLVPGSASVAPILASNIAFSITPNPSAGMGDLSFTLRDRAMVNVTIFNVLGETIASPIQGTCEAGSHSCAFDLSGYAPGTYYCRIQSAGTVETRKVVIEH